MCTVIGAACRLECVLMKRAWMNKDCMNGTTGQVKNIVHEHQMFAIIVKGSNNKEG
jgi:hypothetical protein